nr:MAG TPA: hypothetical protein [Caudoviricetes sp.]
MKLQFGVFILLNLPINLLGRLNIMIRKKSID